MPNETPSEVEQSHNISPQNKAILNHTRTYPYLAQIDGDLPRGKKLKNPIQVSVNFSSDQFIISEDKFYNYGTGETLLEAVEEFKETLAASLESLTIEEPKLGEHLQDELSYLRSIID